MHSQWIKSDSWIKNDRCLTPKCSNHRHEGTFVGDYCSPCAVYSPHSQRFRNLHQFVLSYKQVPMLPDECRDNYGVLKVGDMVTVTCPEFVDRVGYPMSYEEAHKIVEKEHGPALRRFLDETRLYPSLSKPAIPGFVGMVLSDNNWPPTMSRHWKPYNEILRGMAKMFLEEEGYGGNERSIHVVRKPKQHGRVYHVINRAVCYTGLYDRPYSYQDYNGEWESYSGGLTNRKTHVLLELGLAAENMELHAQGYPWPGNKFGSGWWIERCNVRKLA